MFGTVVLILLGLIVAFVAWDWYHKLTFFGKIGVKGPTPLPIFGNIFGFKIGVHTALDKWTKEYGKTFGLFRGATPTIVSSETDFVREVAIKKFSNFQDRAGFPLRPDLMKDDILTLRGKRWRAMRETVALTFSKSKLQKMVQILVDCADKNASGLEEKQTKNDGVVDIYRHMGSFGLYVGANCFFASTFNGPEDEEEMMKHSEAMWSRFKTVYFPWLFIVLFPWLEPVFKWMGCSTHPTETTEYFSNIIRDIIHVRRKDPDSYQYRDFLQLMLNSHHGLDTENVTNGQIIEKRNLKESEIMSQCMTFFSGNMETSPASLAYTFYNLALHPDVQERLIAEVDTVMADGITFETINKMTYMDMVLRESLRMYPTVASIDRRCEEDCVVNGIKIPKGTGVELAVLALQHDPEYWPDPYKFDPERFAKDKYNPMAWLAFGQGPRMCLGYRFAMMEMIAVLTRVFQKFRVEVCAETEIPPSRGTRGLLTPENPIMVRVVPRTDI